MVLNRKRTKSLNIRNRLLKMYVISVLTYAGTTWTQFLKKAHWQKLKVVKTIDLQKVTEMSTFLRHEILLMQFGTTKLEHNI